MAYHSLKNNDDAGDVEVFIAVHVQCQECGAEEIMRAVGWNSDELTHRADCRDKHDVRALPLEWYFAFGSEGYAWEDEPCGSFTTEAGALAQAARELSSRVCDECNPNLDYAEDLETA